jgi:hypothetical protein
MPTSTRRQAASRSQRYSEVSIGALSIDLAEGDDQQDGAEEGEEVDRDFDDDVTIDDAEADLNEAFGENGMSGVLMMRWKEGISTD